MKCSTKIVITKKLNWNKLNTLESLTILCGNGLIVVGCSWVLMVDIGWLKSIDVGCRGCQSLSIVVVGCGWLS